MPEPMRESGPDFVVVGSGPDVTCSTTVRDRCTVLPMSSSAFAAVFSSDSGALLLKLFNMLASPCGLNVSATRVIYPSPCDPAPNVTMASGRSYIFGSPLGGQLRELSAIHESA